MLSHPVPLSTLKHEEEAEQDNYGAFDDAEDTEEEHELDKTDENGTGGDVHHKHSDSNYECCICNTVRQVKVQFLKDSKQKMGEGKRGKCILCLANTRTNQKTSADTRYMEQEEQSHHQGRESRSQSLQGVQEPARNWQGKGTGDHGNATASAWTFSVNEQDEQVDLSARNAAHFWPMNILMIEHIWIHKRRSRSH